MKRTKLFRMMTSAALTAAMVMTMGGMTAFAEEATVSFTKTLDMTEATNASVPDVTFTYTIVPGAAATNAGGREIKAGVGQPTVGTAAYTYETATTALTKDVTVDFSGVTFTAPGIYRYVITEDAVSADTEVKDDITNDTDTTRYLDVYVRSEGSGYEIYNYVLLKTLTNPDADGKYEGAPAGKNEGYENKYTTYSLELTKHVTGDMGETGREFDFTIAFEGPSNATFKLDGTTEVKLDGEGKATVNNIKLADGDSATITGIPSSVKYTVTETAPGDGYTVSHKENEATDYTDGSEVSVEAMGKKNNTVEFKNNRDAVTPTGIVMSFAPYILLVALAGVFAVLFLRKRRHEI